MKMWDREGGGLGVLKFFYDCFKFNEVCLLQLLVVNFKNVEVMIYKGRKYVLDETAIKRVKLFYPAAAKPTIEAVQNNQRFVHYTSAEIAHQIIKNKEIWMRKISYMNDYMEVNHGLECMHEGWKSAAGKRFKKFLENKKTGLFKEITDLFDGTQQNMTHDTYITCVSKHFDGEDEIGRLSMWRAYGGRSGVAIVLKGEPFFRTDNTTNMFSTPAVYLSKEKFQKNFEILVSGIIEDTNFIPEMNPEDLKNLLMRSLYFSALASKHPGFKEEEEWRVIYAPKIWPSTFIKKAVEVINGQPQVVYKIPLENDVNLGVNWIDLNLILDRIIIGPTDNKNAMKEAFLELLINAGVSDAENKIEISDIPLR